jgi:putative flavoprotein involved in K+ transport
MRSRRTDTVVIGAGFAGVAASLELTRRGHSHVVLERGQVGASWQARDWPSFRLNTPNWMNVLPYAPAPADPDGFARSADLRGQLAAAAAGLPIVTDCEVLELVPDGDEHRLETGRGSWHAQTVIAASGASIVPRLPTFAAAADPSLVQLHPATYTGPDGLPDGGVLVVGSGASGMQIAEELAAHGRRVLLASSRVGRVPRRHRGHDLLWWWNEMGRYDERTVDLPDPGARFAPIPHVTGAHGGRTLGYGSLAARGVTLLGGVDDVRGACVRLRPDLGANVRHADETAIAFRTAVDRYIEAEGLDAPRAEADPDDRPLRNLWNTTGPSELQLTRADVGSIIWCTGYDPSFSYLPAGALDSRGLPFLTSREAQRARVFALGVPWLATRASGILLGIRRDAATVAGAVIGLHAASRRSRRAAAHGGRRRVLPSQRRSTQRSESSSPSSASEAGSDQRTKGVETHR